LNLREIIGCGDATLKEKSCVAFGMIPLMACIVNIYEPTATDEEPTKVAVPFPLSIRVTPDGKVDPDARLMAGVGTPLVVTG
jgi:hypothetical protein